MQVDNNVFLEIDIDDSKRPLFDEPVSRINIQGIKIDDDDRSSNIMTTAKSAIRENVFKVYIVIGVTICCWPDS